MSRRYEQLQAERDQLIKDIAAYQDGTWDDALFARVINRAKRLAWLADEATDADAERVPEEPAPPVQHQYTYEFRCDARVTITAFTEHKAKQLLDLLEFECVAIAPEEPSFPEYAEVESFSLDESSPLLVEVDGEDPYLDPQFKQTD